MDKVFKSKMFVPLIVLLTLAVFIVFKDNIMNIMMQKNTPAKPQRYKRPSFTEYPDGKFKHIDYMPLHDNPNRIVVNLKNYDENFIGPVAPPNTDAFKGHQGPAYSSSCEENCEDVKHGCQAPCASPDCVRREARVGSFAQKTNNTMFDHRHMCECRAKDLCKLPEDLSKSCVMESLANCKEKCSLIKNSQVLV